MSAAAARGAVSPTAERLCGVIRPRTTRQTPLWRLIVGWSVDRSGRASCTTRTTRVGSPPGMAHDPQRSSESPLVRWDDFDAVLFDLDGVLTPTAEVHQRAWTRMFDEFLAGRPNRRQSPFSATTTSPTSTASRASTASARSSQSRDIVLPEGDPSDPPGDRNGLRTRQPQERAVRRVAGGGRHRRLTRVPSRSSISWTSWRSQMAVVSSSRNAPDVLRRRRPDRPVHGRRRRQRGRPSRPRRASRHPTCSSRRRADCRSSPVAPSWSRTRVSGVAAGRAGGFALVLGVDRGAGPDALLAHGADMVVDDLCRPCPEATRREEAHHPPRSARSTGSRSTRGGSSSASSRPRPRPDRDVVRRRQRLHRHAGQPRGGPRGPQPRHVPERLPRDVADPRTPRRRSASRKTGQTIVNVPDAKLMKLFVDDEPLLLSTADLAAIRTGARLPQPAR